MTLVAITNTNAIFISNKYIPILLKNGYYFDVNSMRIDDSLQYVINDYNGKYAIIASNKFNDPYDMKDTHTNSFNYNKHTTTITTDLSKRMLHFILDDDVEKGVRYVIKNAQGVVNNYTIEYVFDQDIAKGTEIFMQR